MAFINHLSIIPWRAYQLGSFIKPNFCAMISNDFQQSNIYLIKLDYKSHQSVKETELLLVIVLFKYIE